jgi:alkyl hydroperoxide reductase subunit AhpC
MGERLKRTYPWAYGIDGREFSARTGAFFDEAKGFLHATGFILDPDGRVREAVYSTGPIGRFTAGDALTLIGYMSKSS